MFTKLKVKTLFFLSIASEFSDLKFSNLSSLIFTEKKFDFDWKWVCFNEFRRIFRNTPKWFLMKFNVSIMLNNQLQDFSTLN